MGTAGARPALGRVGEDGRVTNPAPARIGLIGFGAVGRDLVRFLRPEFERGELVMAGAAVRDVVRYGRERDELAAASALPAGWPTTFPGIDALVAGSDLVVECATVQAAWEYGQFVVKKGRTLLLASVGALAEPRQAAVLEGGPGELITTSGAIGGLDALRAAAQADGLDSVTLTTRKQPRSLAAPWMPAEQHQRLAALRPGDEAELLLEGDPFEAIRRFPSNSNVSVALADATRRRDADGALEARSAAYPRVVARIFADPNARRSTHTIEAAGAAGDYRFEFANRPSRDNPRSSALTAQALALEVRQWLARRAAAG